MTPTMTRPYSVADQSACLALFDSNVPAYFAPSERAEFGAFLHDLPAPGRPYLVLWQDGSAVACGGLMTGPAKHQGALVWGMVDRGRHRQGIGSRLTQARIDLARQQPGLTELRLSTSQHTKAFYEGFGFTVSRILPDGFSAGLDQYDMTLRLSRP